MQSSLLAPIRFGAVLAVAASVAACAGSSTSATNAPSAVSYPTTSLQTSTSAAVTLPSVGTSAGGGTVSAVAQLPQASIAATVEEVISASPIGSAPALTSVARAAKALRSPQSGGNTAIVYLAFESTATITLDGVPGITFTLPTTTTGTAYELASYDGSTWNDEADGPVSGSGNTVTFSLSSTGTSTISESQPLEYALYAVSTSGVAASPSASPSTGASPSASPSTSASPSPTPTPLPVASPNALTFDASAPSNQTVVVTETGNTAAFTGSIACTAASPAPSPAPSADYPAQLLSTTSTVPTTNAPASFTVEGGGVPGTCTLTITDANNNATTVSVTVNETDLTITGKRRAH